MSLDDLAGHTKILRHLEAKVLSSVEATLERERIKMSDMVAPREEHLQRWWTFWAQRSELRRWMSTHSRMIAASRTQRWPFIFSFVSTQVLPGDKLQVFALDDDYSFGVLQSSAHCDWFAAKGARLKNEVDYNYSSRSVFQTYPWPQSPSKASVIRVAEAARDVRQARQKALGDSSGMRTLYAGLALPGKSVLRDAHEALNAAVIDAYEFKPKHSLLQQLLEVNAQVSGDEASGRAAQGPGIPKSQGSIKALTSSDAILA